MMNRKKAEELLLKYKQGVASQEEKAWIETWYARFKDKVSTVPNDQIMADQQESWLLLEQEYRSSRKVRLWPRIAVAAAVAAIIFGAGLFYFGGDNHLDPDKITYQNDVAPGNQGATLTLANGKQIKLSDAANGELAKEAGISISKTADGQLVYQVKANENDPDKINTLRTAKGETYVLTLPDKSKVWLNAASSLTYSANLVQNGQRKVKLIGEAYFQVSRDKKRPFIVESGGQQVEVLGTHFNINSYADEVSTKTTLLEGSVSVSLLRGPTILGPATILKPNQQAVLMANHQIKVQPADTEETLAWKEGYFRFNGEGVESIMRKLSRWYDIEVVYEGKISKEAYYAKVSRSKNISAVLKALEKSQGVHFKIEGRRVTVLE